MPAVDFDTRMVAAVFAGERPTPGFAVEVIGTRREGADLVVLLDERHSRPHPRGGAGRRLAVSHGHAAARRW